MRKTISAVAAIAIGLSVVAYLKAADAPGASPGDAMLREYFEREVRGIEAQGVGAKTLEEWKSKRGEYRRELAEMLGLWPEPVRGDLKAQVRGRVEAEEFVVEKLVFQSLPGLYVTGDVYVPRNLEGRAPAILYVCGHSDIKENGVSMGNKVGYQHHGEWFARNGYVCLTIDSLELGEITGVHHGTYRDGMWWWHSRGYTPAGVEAWNSMRAIDYLCTRSDVDSERIGMTGRSGGGAYTWFTAALDERVKVAAPVAGITDLRNHIIDGCIEGHCDCMFMVNTYRWDFARVAALVAPRPLQIGNSDKDTIFPLDGVQRVHAQVRDVYRMYGQEKNLGLLITEGPHKDTQDLQVPVFRWFNRFLKNEQGTVDKVATPMMSARQLKVFDALPEDSINGRVQELFVPAAPRPAAPASKEEWSKQRDERMAALRSKTFGGWPENAPPLEIKQAFNVTHQGVRLSGFDFVSQPGVVLRLYVARNDGGSAKEVVLRVLDEADWKPWVAEMSAGGFGEQLTSGGAASNGDFAPVADALKKGGVALAWVAPRGVGPTAWTGDTKKKTQVLRRFALLGQTLDGMRVWDVRRAVSATGKVQGLEQLPVRVRGRGQMAGVALYAALFEPVKGEELAALPRSHREGPYVLNVLKTLDIDDALAIEAERANVKLYEESGERKYPRGVAAKLGRASSIEIGHGEAPQWP
jgi:dienelactone hydrolase